MARRGRMTRAMAPENSAGIGKDFWLALRSLFGYRQRPVNIRGLFQFDMDPVVSGTARSWYQSQLALHFDRNRLYQEYEEMDGYDILSGALDTYAEDSTQRDPESGRSIWSEAKDKSVRADVHQLLEVMDAEEQIYSVARSLAKYGDNFEQLAYEGGRGVIGSRFVPGEYLTRVEDDLGRLIGFIPGVIDHVDPTAVSDELSQPWDFVHFRLPHTRRELIHGLAMIWPARRTWRQLKICEDSLVYYRLHRAPDRLVHKIDVGDLAYEQKWQAVERYRRQFRKRQHLDPVTGEYKQEYDPMSIDDEYYIAVGRDDNTDIELLSGSSNYDDIVDVLFFRDKLFAALGIPKAYLGFEGDIECLGLDTEIACLEGEDRTLGEIIADYEETGRLPYVYSVNSDGNVVAGKVTWAGITRRDAKLVRVHLDNGESFDCTPDHPCMLRDGTFKDAKELKPGQSLMPLYDRTGRAGYEEVQHPSDGRWEPTHRMVARSTRRLAERMVSLDDPVIHHDAFDERRSQFDKRNNDPRKLRVLTRAEHMKRHYEKHGAMNGHWLELRECEHCGDVYKPDNQYRKFCSPQCSGASPETRQKMRDGQQSSRRVQKGSVNRVCVVCGKEFRLHTSRATKSFLEQTCSGGCYKKQQSATWVTIECQQCGEEVTATRSKKRKFCTKRCAALFNNAARRNHKVVRVEWLKDREDTGDITVEGTHNFALASGVFVHNSKATLSQQDIRFARKMKRLQRALIMGYTRAAEIHIALKHGREAVTKVIDEGGRDPLGIRLSSISYLDDLQRSELYQLRVDLADRLASLGQSMELNQAPWLTWILTSFMGLSEDYVSTLVNQAADVGGGEDFESFDEDLQGTRQRALTPALKRSIMREIRSMRGRVPILREFLLTCAEENPASKRERLLRPPRLTRRFVSDHGNVPGRRTVPRESFGELRRRVERVARDPSARRERATSTPATRSQRPVVMRANRGLQEERIA